MKSKLVQLTLLLFCGWTTFAQGTRPQHVTFFGSSVCRGTGAENNHGYAWQFFNSGAIDTTKYRYFNASTGGDNTLKVEKEDRMTLKLFPTNPDFVVIGLSLGNEGILSPKTDDGREMILEQYRSRLLAMADSLASLDMKPIIVNCYSNAYFTEAHYAITNRMNRHINTWKYPSINVLGTVDDFTGKWVKDLESDALHPNTTGHQEMSYAIVPSLFDALTAGKETPSYDWHNSYATLLNAKKEEQPLHLTIDGTMHSFTLSFRFKNSEDGSIAGFESGGTVSQVVKRGDTIGYKNSIGTLTQDLNGWTQVVLSHSYANQKTTLYINGRPAGSVSEKLSPTRIFFGGTSPRIDLKDLMLHRAALNSSEIRDIYQKKFIQSSLEFYNPLTQPIAGNTVGNFAQSLSELNKANPVILTHQAVGF